VQLNGREISNNELIVERLKLVLLKLAKLRLRLVVVMIGKDLLCDKASFDV
jgi:hypothetical protein